MDVKEKLVELLDRFVYDEWYGNNDIADKLIANGVTLQTQKTKEGHMTNADKIRSMSDGELLELLRMIYATGKADGVALAEKQRGIDFELTSKWLMQEDE